MKKKLKNSFFVTYKINLNKIQKMINEIIQKESKIKLITNFCNIIKLYLLLILAKLVINKLENCFIYKPNINNRRIFIINEKSFKCFTSFKNLLLYTEQRTDMSIYIIHLKKKQ